MLGAILLLLLYIVIIIYYVHYIILHVTVKEVTSSATSITFKLVYNFFSSINDSIFISIAIWYRVGV